MCPGSQLGFGVPWWTWCGDMVTLVPRRLSYGGVWYILRETVSLGSRHLLLEAGIQRRLSIGPGLCWRAMEMGEISRYFGSGNSRPVSAALVVGCF